MGLRFDPTPLQQLGPEQKFLDQFFFSKDQSETLPFSHSLSAFRLFVAEILSHDPER